MWGKYSKNGTDEIISNYAKENCVVKLNPGMIDDEDDDDGDGGVVVVMGFY